MRVYLDLNDPLQCVELGLEPHHRTDEVIGSMLERVLQYERSIDRGKILPRVVWKRPEDAGG